MESLFILAATVIKLLWGAIMFVGGVIMFSNNSV